MVFIPYIFDFFQFPGLAWHTKWHLCGKSGIYDGFIDLKTLLFDFSSSKTYKSILIMVLYHIFYFSNLRVSRSIKSGIYVVKVVYMMFLSN